MKNKKKKKPHKNVIVGLYVLNEAEVEAAPSKKKDVAKSKKKKVKM